MVCIMMQTYKVSEEDAEIVRKELDKIIQGYKRIILYPYGSIGRFAASYLQKFPGIEVIPADNLLKENGVMSRNQMASYLQKDEEVAVYITTVNKEFYDGLIDDKEMLQYSKDRLFRFKGSVRGNIQIESFIKGEMASVREEKAMDFARYLREKEVSVCDNQFYAGRIFGTDAINMLPSGLAREVKYIKREIGTDYTDILGMEQEGLICRNPGNHVIPGYDCILQVGINESILMEEDEIRIMLLESLQIMIEHYQESAEKLDSFNGKRIAKACSNIKTKKPETMFEAIQLLILLHETVVQEAGCGSISFGRVDQYLYPFYKHDKEVGVLNDELAQEMIIEFWRKISELPMSWQNITLGGCLSDGVTDGCNELTIMGLEATRVVHADQPQVSLRNSGNMPKEIWDKALEVIASGGGMPSIVNDKVAIAAKEYVGIKRTEAVNYGVMGCVELCIGGKEYAHTEGMRLNLAKVLEIVMQEADKMKITDFRKFLDYYYAKLDKYIRRLCDFLDVAGDYYGRQWPVPYLSLFMEGCRESGRDVTQKGTRYNLSTICLVGFGTTVDGLEAIRECIFERQEITWKSLREQLENNFTDESVRNLLIKCKKYGNDLESSNQIAKDLTAHIQDVVEKYNRKGPSRVIQLGYYTSYFHSDFGKMTGATPDGRYAGEALSPSFSASSGQDTSGPLALMNSAVCSDMSKFGNGMALDIRFTKSFLKNRENRDKLVEIIEGYFKKGGMEIQINCFDSDELRDAQIHPEKYKDLVVRVAGFSAYFIRLDEALQNEIIRRNANEAM